MISHTNGRVLVDRSTDSALEGTASGSCLRADRISCPASHQ